MLPLVLALPDWCVRGIGSPDLANPFFNLPRNGMCSVQQLLSFDDQLPIDTVLHRISWGFHRAQPETNWDWTGHRVYGGQLLCRRS
jgi:hypothetical protein